MGADLRLTGAPSAADVLQHRFRGVFHGGVAGPLSPLVGDVGADLAPPFVHGRRPDARGSDVSARPGRLQRAAHERSASRVGPRAPSALQRFPESPPASHTCRPAEPGVFPGRRPAFHPPVQRWPQAVDDGRCPNRAEHACLLPIPPTSPGGQRRGVEATVCAPADVAASRSDRGERVPTGEDQDQPPATDLGSSAGCPVRAPVAPAEKHGGGSISDGLGDGLLQRVGGADPPTGSRPGYRRRRAHRRDGPGGLRAGALHRGAAHADLPGPDRTVRGPLQRFHLDEPRRPGDCGLARRGVRQRGATRPASRSAGRDQGQPRLWGTRHDCGFRGLQQRHRRHRHDSG